MTDTTAAPGKQLRRTLRGLGITNRAIDAVWPRWWTEAADTSASARAELTFAVARHLGLDPRSLLSESQGPSFVWAGAAHFKRLSGESSLELAGITSFGRAVATAALAASPDPQATVVGASPAILRDILLSGDRPFVGLADLLALAWGSGIPVIHLRVFPWARKRMAAMTVRVGDRWAILVAKDSTFPAAIAFYVGHELGHIAHDQIEDGSAIVDLEDGERRSDSEDDEELRADEFSLELLTGDPSPTVLPAGRHRSGSELARTATAAGADLGIEPGVLAEVFGYSTSDWLTATDALRRIYRPARAVWREINRVARSELDMEAIPQDAAEFLDRVLGDAG